MEDLNEVYYDGNNKISVSTETPYDGIWFEIYEPPYADYFGGNFICLKLNKEKSMDLANKILEYWNNNEKQ